MAYEYDVHVLTAPGRARQPPEHTACAGLRAPQRALPQRQARRERFARCAGPGCGPGALARRRRRCRRPAAPGGTVAAPRLGRLHRPPTHRSSRSSSSGTSSFFFFSVVIDFMPCVASAKSASAARDNAETRLLSASAGRESVVAACAARWRDEAQARGVATGRPARRRGAGMRAWRSAVFGGGGASSGCGRRGGWRRNGRCSSPTGHCERRRFRRKRERRRRRTQARLLGSLRRGRRLSDRLRSRLSLGLHRRVAPVPAVGLAGHGGQHRWSGVHFG